MMSLSETQKLQRQLSQISHEIFDIKLSITDLKSRVRRLEEMKDIIG